MDSVTLEWYHLLSHTLDICPLHYRVAYWMDRKGLRHVSRTLCDRVYELLISDWRTYDPSKVPDEVLRDDYRIACHIWGKWFKENPGRKFMSDQFKDLTRKEQIRVIKSLCRKIVQEMERRGWTVKTKPVAFELSMREIKFPDDLGVITPEYLKMLSDRELIDLYRKLHDYYAETKDLSEVVQDVNILIGTEMLNRGLYMDYRIEDLLTWETDLEIVEYPTEKGFASLSWSHAISRERFYDLMPQRIILWPVVRVAGRLINTGVTPPGHDIDLWIQLPFDSRIVESLRRESSGEVSDRLHINFRDQPPLIGYCSDLYYLSLEKVPKEVFLRRQSPWELSIRLEPGVKVKINKPKSGWRKNEFWSAEEAWVKVVSKWKEEGHWPVVIQPKKDGRAFSIHVDRDKGLFKIITEDRQRDRSDQFPSAIDEFLKKTKIKSAIMIAEVIPYDCHGKDVIDKEEICDFIPRRKAAALTVGKVPEEMERNTVFHLHDIIYLNGEDIHDKGYLERWRILQKVIPPRLRHWRVVRGWVADNMRDFFRYVRMARAYKNSEGAMVKTADYKYILKTSGEARTPYVCKIKNLKELDVMVWEPIQKKTSEGKPLNQWVYESVFLIPCSIKDQFPKDRVVEWKGKCYVKIGRTYGTDVRCKRGDIITVRPIAIFDEVKDGVHHVSWMFPYFDIKREDKTTPDTWDTVQKIIRLGTGPAELMQYLSDDYSDMVKAYLSDEVYINLPICPYSDMDFCPLRDQFARLRRVNLQTLVYPIRCRLAYIFRCPYVKPYYYKYRSADLEG